MRRALLTQWPAITKFYGLFPWDVERLTPDELSEYVAQMEKHLREQKRAQQRAERARSR